MFTKEKFLKVLSIPDSAFYTEATYNDPISRKIDDEERQEIIEKSAETGINCARKFKKMFPEKELKDYLIDQEIEIVINKESQQSDYIYFGAYDINGPLTIFEENIRKCETLIDKKSLDMVDINTIIEVVFTHEFFHHLEDTTPDLYTNEKNITLWKLGSYEHSSKLVCTSEIGAMAFAKEFLELNYNSSALNYLLYSGVDEGAGEKYYQKMLSLLNKYKQNN